jgi:curli biogenesis system outer membrane secretion channel CsgG
MRSRGLHPAKAIGIAAAALALCGCMTAAPDATGRYVTPAGGAPAIANDTPYSGALRCLASYTAGRRIRIAVGDIANDTGGHQITRGGALMAMSALAKAGVPLIERAGISAADLDPQGRLRPDYYLMGGITELNANLRSNVSVGGPSVMNIALDLRLVDTRTSGVTDLVSYQKQILVSDWVQEPIQLAVRSIIERAVLEMMTRLYAAPEAVCRSSASSSAAQVLGVTQALQSQPGHDWPPRTRTAAAISPASLRGRYDNSDAQTPGRFFTPIEPASEPRLRRRFD